LRRSKDFTHRILPISCTALLLFAAIIRTAAAQSDSKVRVAFVGDSLSDGIWGGTAALVPRNSCLKGSVELGRFAKNSTGLTRPERFSWPDEVRRIGESFKPALFVMSLGLNDRQSVVFGGRVTLENSHDYSVKYKERVTAVLQNAVASTANLLWVGLPAMRDAAADRDAREKNRMFAEAISEFGNPAFQYVTPWRLNGSGEDKFASYGPDQNGKIIQIRASDGEHFTPAGQMIVAAYLLPKMIATLRSRGVKLDDACAS
jgi:hypothetical protein